MSVERDKLSVKKPDQIKSTIDTNIFSYSLRDLQEKHQLLTDLVQSYRRIFGEEPWNEWVNCSQCGRKYGRSDYLKDLYKTDRCCSKQELIEFHPAKKVEDMLTSDLSVPNSTPFLFVAQQEEMSNTDYGNNVAGFIWGYSTSSDVVMKKVIADMPTKYGVKAQEDMLAAMPNIVKERLISEHLSCNVSYVAEIGVSENKRNGVALGQLMQAVTENQRLTNPTYLFWTQRSAKIYPIINMLNGKTIYSFNEEATGDDHVFMAGDLNHLHDIFENYPPAKLQRYFLSKRREERNKV
jgi:hypothetical protein